MRAIRVIEWDSSTGFKYPDQVFLSPQGPEKSRIRKNSYFVRILPCQLLRYYYGELTPEFIVSLASEGAKFAEPTAQKWRIWLCQDHSVRHANLPIDSFLAHHN
jgi:hypothetical protein